MFDGGGLHFRGVFDGSFTAGGGVGCQVSGPSSCYFGGLLCRRLESGVREVKVRVVVPTGRDLGRDGAGRGKKNGEDLN